MRKLVVDLNNKPCDRWVVDGDFKQAIEELLEYYLKDLGFDDDYLGGMGDLLTVGIPEEYLGELKGISDKTQIHLNRVVAGNLYYDFMKMVIGCTAFSAPTGEGPLHARNLDWLSTGSTLSRLTLITEYINGPQGTFSTIGWSGIVGALSGVADNRFSITLNAALSNDKNESGIPVAFLIRDVLQNVSTFVEAVGILSTTTIPCDCLLLVTGLTNDECVVIERTPSRFAQRWAKDGVVTVTNDFINLKVSADKHIPDNELVASSCGRFNRICELLQDKPKDADECMAYLSDSKVQMDITEQQMVFHARSGAVLFQGKGY
ncbi:hypothetical protein A9Q99_08785 [Gammaproteobacteria bacterium 45_16_T64]|nr:hypothetical protein A9Q99_08785 [Gammaproteobacteria bacterium 45_16_T64]